MNILHSQSNTHDFFSIAEPKTLDVQDWEPQKAFER